MEHFEENDKMEEKPKSRASKISLELKIDQMMQYIDKTMHTWMMVVNEIREENAKMNMRITNIEKDIRFLKNRKTESVVSTLPMRRVESEVREDPSVGFDLDQQVQEMNTFSRSRSGENDYHSATPAELSRVMNTTLQSKVSSFPNAPAEKVGMQVEDFQGKLRRPNMVSSVKMASQCRMVESATIQMPRNQFQKIVQMSSSSGEAIQQMLSHQNGSVFTSVQQQHFQQQQMISKSQSTPTLPMHPPLAIEYPIMIRQYRDLKTETFSFEEAFIRKCLEMNSMIGDMKMFQKMYLENVSKEFYPIRYVKKTYQYWLNGRMHDDIGGSYIKNTISRNIEILYMKMNTFEYYGEKVDKFMNNQEHICKLSDEKYKDKMLQQIIQIII